VGTLGSQGRARETKATGGVDEAGAILLTKEESAELKSGKSETSKSQLKRIKNKNDKANREEKNKKARAKEKFLRGGSEGVWAPHSRKVGGNSA